MPAAAPTTPPTGAPRFWQLRGVKLFASGEYRGKTWTPATLRLIARNAGRLGPADKRLLVPPSVLGHEEEQEWLDRTDLPAAGWVDPATVRAVPDPDHAGELILTGDVVNIPDRVKREKLDTGEYRFGSAEIYDDFRDDFGTSYGKALRRFALLGGEVPQVKRLGSLPAPEPMRAPKKFSERPGVRIRETAVRRGPTTHYYAETTVMDRQQMMAAAMQAMPGVSQATLDALSDEQLADLVKNLPAPATPAADPAMGAGAPAMFAESREEMVAALVDMGQDAAELEAMDDEEVGALYEEMTAAEGDGEEPETEDMGDPAAMPREELIAELVAQGQDAAALEGMGDEELRALYAQLTGGATAAAPAAPAAPMTPMSERRKPKPKPKQRGVTVLSETTQVARKARRLNDALDGELRRLRVANHARKREDAERFCDRLILDGRATPAHVKALHLPVLLALDDTRSVHKHSENGRTRAVSAYELKKLELAALPKVVHLGERLPGGAPKSDDAAEAAKVREFAETVPETALRAGGYKSREQFVQKFSELRKKDATLTAKQYLGT